MYIHFILLQTSIEYKVLFVNFMKKCNFFWFFGQRKGKQMLVCSTMPCKVRSPQSRGGTSVPDCITRRGIAVGKEYPSPTLAVDTAR